jgi:hypothetical protein
LERELLFVKTDISLQQNTFYTILFVTPITTIYKYIEKN